MAGLFVIDIKRLVPNMSDKKLIRIAQVLTLVFAAVTMLLAAQGFSVLYLFLVADLICAGAVFAVFYGMFFKGADPGVAFIASLLGIVCGALLFPDPEFTRGTLAGSFSVALVLPAFIVLAFGRGKNHPA
jgi:Na+/proline symporter